MAEEFVEIKVTPYLLTDVEKDIRAEDFPEGSLYNKMVKHCGPASAKILAEYQATVSEKLSLRDYTSVIKRAQKRYFVAQGLCRN